MKFLSSLFLLLFVGTSFAVKIDKDKDKKEIEIPISLDQLARESRANSISETNQYIRKQDKQKLAQRVLQLFRKSKSSLN